MTTTTHRLLIVAAAVLCLLLALTAWGVVRLVAWAAELPNRINIQFEGEGVTAFITEGVRMTLRQPDPEQQFECLQMLADGIRTNPEVVPWIQAELESEISTLRNSPDPRVATLADEVHLSFAPP